MQTQKELIGQTTTKQHIPILDRGVEYDDDGYICGEWAAEVCCQCGAQLGFMNSPVFCEDFKEVPGDQ